MSVKILMQEKAVNEGLNPTGVSGIDLYKLSAPYPRQSMISIPALCFIGQGEKHLYLGDEKIVYDEGNYLLGSMNMPIESELPLATPEKPYLGLVVHIDHKIIGDLLTVIEADMIGQDISRTDKIISSSPVTPDLETCLIRILQAMSDPMTIKVLGEDMKRELFYHCLRSDCGGVLKNCVQNHMNAHRMARIIRYIEQNFTSNIDIKEISHLAGMSSSSLHEHFKEATSLSPI